MKMMYEVKWECWETKLLGKIRNTRNVIWLRKLLHKRADKKWAKVGVK